MSIYIDRPSRIRCSTSEGGREREKEGGRKE